MGTMKHFATGLVFDGVTLRQNEVVLLDLSAACWSQSSHLERWQAVNRVWNRVVETWEKTL